MSRAKTEEQLLFLHDWAVERGACDMAEQVFGLALLELDEKPDAPVTRVLRWSLMGMTVVEVEFILDFCVRHDVPGFDREPVYYQSTSISYLATALAKLAEAECA